MTEDDVPMMHVGPPTPTPPNQVTTKPRQQPSGGGGGPEMGGLPADGGPLDFDPETNGGPVDDARAEGNDLDAPPNVTDDAQATEPDAQFGDKVAKVGIDVLEANPGMEPHEALRIAASVVQGVAIGRPQIGDLGIGDSHLGLGDIFDAWKTKQKTFMSHERDEDGNRKPHLYEDEEGNLRPKKVNPARQREHDIAHWMRNRLKRKGPDGPDGPDGQGEPQDPADPDTSDPRNPSNHPENLSDVRDRVTRAYEDAKKKDEGDR